MGLVDPEAVRRVRVGAAARRGDARRVAEPHARDPRREDRDDLPGPDDLAEPGQDDRLAARGGGADPPGRLEEGGAQARDRGPGAGRDPARRTARRRLPAPVLGRHAPARDDRDGADQQPGDPDRRRADDRARRDDPGADPAPDGAPPAGVSDGDRDDHPRPRRRRRARGRRDRHVRRPRGRAGEGRRPLREAGDALHVGAARLVAAPQLLAAAASSRFPASRRRCSIRPPGARSIRAAST